MDVPERVLEPLRILLDVEPLYGPLTGIGWYTRHLAEGLASHAALSELKFIAHGRVLRDRPTDAFGPTKESAAPVRLLSGLLRRARPVLAGSRAAVAVYERALPWAWKRSLRQFATSHVVHAPSFVLPDFPGRSVVTFHDLSTVLMPEFHPVSRVGFINRAMERAVHTADHIITDSEFVRGQVLRHFGVAENRCTAISLGASDEFRVRSAAECEGVLAPHELVFKQYGLFLSTIEPRKNLERVLHAHLACVQRGMARFPLVIVGHPGWRNEREHELIARMQRAGYVRYLGYASRQEIVSLVAGARFLVFPSLYEGFGLPVLEAMQSGTAVLTSSDSAMEEVCGPAAVTVEPRSVGAITDAMALLMNDDARVQRLSGAGVQRAREFSWARCVEQTVDVYRKLG